MNGFAYLDKDRGIVINTVCDTETGAMVNALVTVALVTVFAGTSDAQVRGMFDKWLGNRGTIVPVTVSVKTN